MRARGTVLRFSRRSLHDGGLIQLPIVESHGRRLLVVEPWFGPVIKTMLSTLSTSQTMSSSHLSSLAIFRNKHNQELVRSVHGYGDGNDELKWIEREFRFTAKSCIEVIKDGSVNLIDTLKVNLCVIGEIIGDWICVLSFDLQNSSSYSLSVPSFLCPVRNPSLRSLPNLANDLQKVYMLTSRSDGDEICSDIEKECSNTRKLDISSLTDKDQLLPEVRVHRKKKRAKTDYVANISLSELAKYFSLPITEASKNLKVGLTVLKRKCREFGIPRWPHRKIKSLDKLIHDLQEEASKQEKESKIAAVKAVMKRQQMLAYEKEGILTRPFMEIQRETKRFRQDVFKRRHKAKALSSKMYQQSEITD